MGEAAMASRIGRRAVMSVRYPVREEESDIPRIRAYNILMKTSIEFDDDVAALIKLRTRSGKTMRQVVNDLIRRAVTPLPPLRD